MPSEVGSGGERLRLKVEGWRGSQVVFSNTTLVTTTPRFLSILVQMSRPVYTGGQKGELRCEDDEAIKGRKDRVELGWIRQGRVRQRRVRKDSVG